MVHELAARFPSCALRGDCPPLARVCPPLASHRRDAEHSRRSSTCLGSIHPTLVVRPGGAPNQVSRNRPEAIGPTTHVRTALAPLWCLSPSQGANDFRLAVAADVSAARKCRGWKAMFRAATVLVLRMSYRGQCRHPSSLSLYSSYGRAQPQSASNRP
jgi:hypothetical protein